MDYQLYLLAWIRKYAKIVSKKRNSVNFIGDTKPKALIMLGVANVIIYGLKNGEKTIQTKEKFIPTIGIINPKPNRK